MSKLTVVAKVVAKKNSVDLVKTELQKLIVPTKKENGCIEYKLHQDTVDPSMFIFYETWESQAFLEQHMSSDHFKNYIRAVDGMIAEKIVHLMNQIA
jgi:quinol monooxygenase YgiN